MAFQPTDPVKALQISQHTAHAIQELRTSTSIEQLMARHRAFIAYAESAGVVMQIRSHVCDVVREKATEIKANRAPRNGASS